MRFLLAVAAVLAAGHAVAQPIPGTSGGGGSGTPGGSSGQIQYNNAGAFGGVAAPSGVIVGTTDTQTLSNKSIAASEVNSGTMACAQMPALTGGVTTSAGSCATTPGTNTALLNAAQSFTAAQRGTPSTLAISTATFTPSFDTAQNFAMTLIHASCPCTLANPSTTPVAGQAGMIAVTQSATGTDLIGTWGSSYKFAGGTAPTLSTGASNVDFLPYYVFSSTQIIIGAGVLNAH